MTGLHSGKGERVRTMFDRLAPRYDLMNRIMTFGRDQYWRRFVVDKAEPDDSATVLDLASGTGDIALEVRRRFPGARIVAADFSQVMLDHGKARPGGETIEWMVCDAMALPFEDEIFDVVTFGYLLRNVEDIGLTLREVLRVLKPGGRVVCLDTCPPPPGWLNPLIRAYLRWGCPLLGWLVTGNSASYAYLSHSTLAFQNPERLEALFQESGFRQTAHRRFMFGTIAVHWARKPR